ncbi:MAG: hypothetical protein ACYTDX_02545 [Planctomycetota bacterium]
MPREIRLCVKTAMLFLITSMALGAALTGWKHLGGHRIPWPWIAVHTHLALVGGVLLMIMGVAFWMFPLDRERRPQWKGRNRPGVVYLTYGLLVGGLVLRAVMEPIAGETTGGVPGMLLVAAAVLQLAAMFVFVTEIWSRVRKVHSP